jgi:hypothetical protein
VAACEDIRFFHCFFDIIVEDTLASKERLQAQEQMKVTWRLSSGVRPSLVMKLHRSASKHASLLFTIS